MYTAGPSNTLVVTCTGTSLFGRVECKSSLETYYGSTGSGSSMSEDTQHTGQARERDRTCFPTYDLTQLPLGRPSSTILSSAMSCCTSLHVTRPTPPVDRWPPCSNAVTCLFAVVAFLPLLTNTWARRPQITSSKHEWNWTSRLTQYDTLH